MTPVILKPQLFTINTRLLKLVLKTAKTRKLPQRRGIIFSLCDQTFVTRKRSRLRGLKAYTLCRLGHDYKISNVLQFTVMQSTLCISVLRYFSLHKAPPNCPFLSVLGRCPSCGEYSYSKMTDKRWGLKPGVRLTEVSVL